MECCSVEGAGAGSGQRGDNCRLEVPGKVKGTVQSGAFGQTGSRLPGQKRALWDWDT